MHNECFRFVSQYATNATLSVIEIGSRDINGTTRPLFPSASWVGLDLHAGPCVDWVGDAVEYVPESQVDLVICTEVLEHAENWRELIAIAASWLMPGGQFIVTCAGPGRDPHSHHDGAALRDGEHYGNLTCDQVTDAMRSAGLTVLCVAQGQSVLYLDHYGTDIRVVSYRPHLKIVTL